MRPQTVKVDYPKLKTKSKPKNERNREYIVSGKSKKSRPKGLNDAMSVLEQVEAELNGKPISKSKSKMGHKRGSKWDEELKEPHIDDNGVLMVKINKKTKANEFTKPGFEKYKPDPVTYTDLVMQKLDKIQNPKAKKVNNKKSKPAGAGKR